MYYKHGCQQHGTQFTHCQYVSELWNTIHFELVKNSRYSSVVSFHQYRLDISFGMMFDPAKESITFNAPKFDTFSMQKE